MPNKQRTNVRKSLSLDARTRRTTTALAYALIQLIQEGDGPFEDITVRQILQRAGVGRTTFYSHFRSKEDVLHSTYEGIFGAH
ncbi:MAG TPA: TetR/AcrR family transcriptional regulator, partial [Gemmatimonadaceae bacterium]|nr:TetR/AcrR family transcriptional regulator [Gemmatimonadaceae bacterium]